ncbi:MAG TPA: glycosyltransferase family 2 protein [Chthoniobacterales bacterium]|jgi:GT2 family glycosyltransferase
MSGRFSRTSRADFAREVARKLAPARLLLVGAEAAQLAADWRDTAIEKIIFENLAAVESPWQNGSSPHFDLAIWIYPAADDESENSRSFARLTNSARDLLLIPAVAADASKRRPDLVRQFLTLGFFPDYASEIIELEPDAVLLRRDAVESPVSLVPEIEAGFARVNAHLHGLERSLRTRLSELEAADLHIARLEEKVLLLKKAKRDLKQLKAEKQALRKSPERKIGQVLLAPYRLPEKLIRQIRKRSPRAVDDPRKSASPNEYERWLRQHQATPAELTQMREESRTFASRPLVSVITPIFNTPADWLEEMIESVRAQTYENWELMLIDDGSTEPTAIEALDRLAATDERIHLLRQEKNAGISGASNRGIEAAAGDWVGFLDHDDLLEPDALFQNAKLLQQNPDADLIYSDEDKLTEIGFDAPFLKPDWSPDFFLSYNYICHFTVIRRALVRQLGGLHSEFDFAQDYDLYLRVMSATSRIYHIPRVLYHWRRSANSTATNLRVKPQALDAARGALEAYLARSGVRGHVAVDWNTHGFRIRREILEEKRIAIIIPTRDRIDLLARCIASVEAKTVYEKYEIVIVDNDSQSDEAREYFAQTRHRVLHFSGPFNYAAINNFAVEKIDAPWLLFLNNDAEVIASEWLTAMAEHVQRPEIGAVGARLLFRDDTIQHAGIVLGVRGMAKHSFLGFPAESPGVCRQLQVTRNYSAVTAACMLTRRDVFEEVGGFDEERLPVIFNDVDLCLKMRRAGYLVVYTPFAKLYHDESASRRPSVEPVETEVLRTRWPAEVERDPFYHPSLSREQADFSLGEPRPARHEK